MTPSEEIESLKAKVLCLGELISVQDEVVAEQSVRLRAERDRLVLAEEEARLSLVELKATQQRLMEASRKAGMADVATSVLHNVGNVLNSVNVSASLAIDRLRESQVAALRRAVSLLEAQPDRAQFLLSDPRGAKLMDFFGLLAKSLAEERDEVLGELRSLTRDVDHIKVIISTQQAHAKAVAVVEPTSLSSVISDALAVNAASTDRHAIEVVTDFTETDSVETDRHKVFQIIVNLLSNARHAMGNCEGERTLTVRTRDVDDSRIAIEVHDTGVGIAPEHRDRIFNHGFTTKPDGHGFGLHSSACAAIELRGLLRVESEGLGRGATFILELPRVWRGESEAA